MFPEVIRAVRNHKVHSKSLREVTFAPVQIFGRKDLDTYRSS